MRQYTCQARMSLPVAGPDQKARIRESRVKSTELLANALAGLDSPPKVFACASATGYYGDRGDETLTEDAAPGSDFLAGVGVEWENAATAAADAGIRVVNMRISVVLTAAGGMVATVGPIFRLGLGGRLGSGSAVPELDIQAGHRPRHAVDS